MRAPAHETQRKTLELTARLRGHMKDADKSGDVNSRLMQMIVHAINNPSDQPIATLM